MQLKIFIAVLFFGTCCFSQDDYIRPQFPDVFQTEVQGIFIKEKEVVEIDGDLYYDRDNNRAAYRMTMNGETSTSIYNFNSNEVIAIDGNECVVNEISDNPMESFFQFTLDEQKKKKIWSPDKILYFSKSKLDRQQLSIIPTLIFTAAIDIPFYGRSNCQVMHVFSKPDLELPNCKENQLCESTLLTISVKCKDESAHILVDHVYNFFRFTSGIADESIFLPPVGVHCDMKSSKSYPAFPSYYSFNFDTVEKMVESDDEWTVFITHRQFYFDGKNKVIRIDEFDGNGLLASSRVYDLQAATTFMIVPIINKCSMLPILEKINVAEISRLPTMFFQNDTTVASVFVGKRTLNGLTYDVWSYQWMDKNSDSKVVEEVYFLEVTPELKGIDDTNKPFLQISHADVYTYEIKDESLTYDFTLLERITMNNYRTSPKEFSAFDVQTCFSRRQRKDFYMKINNTHMIKESQVYGEILEHLYNKIIAVVGVSILRISEMRGDFDGAELIGIKGSILEVTNETGWAKSKQPGMDETLERMKTAALQGNLSVTFKNEYGEETTLDVLSVGDPLKPKDYTRPTFPDVFQTAVQGILKTEKEVVEIDGDLYYDRDNNRAAYRLTMNGETTTTIYNFNTDQTIAIEGNQCVVKEISDDPMETFFLFTLDEKNKKKILGPDEIMYFSKSELNRQDLSFIPTLIFTAIIDIPFYGTKNCGVMHMFSKPGVEKPTCKEDELCESTLLTMSINCKDETGSPLINHVYNFFRFTAGIVDESIFLPPVGVHCDMNSSKTYPAFPSYYSFAFDVVEKMKESDDESTVFITHREFYFEDENEIIRIDEFDGNGLLASSRVYDLQAETAFMIVPVVNKCYMLPIFQKIDFAEISRLPKMLFQNDSNDTSVFVGKRTLDGPTYEVWSYQWTDKKSEAKVVEEVYFLEVTPELKGINDKNEPFLQISHADTYTYEIKDESMKYDLTLHRRIIINNYRTSPKEFSAFDVQTCFNHSQRRDFYMTVNGTDMVKESQAFGEILEHLYNKIIAVVGVSALRISELTGDFDGTELIGIKGSILEVTSQSGWEKSKQPGMDEAFERMKTAATQGKLSVTFKKEYSQETTFDVLSVEDPLKLQEAKEPDCYSGGSMAAVSLVLLLIGMFFGIAGYYVFLKKRRSPTNTLLMESIDSRH